MDSPFLQLENPLFAGIVTVLTSSAIERRPLAVFGAALLTAYRVEIRERTT